MLSGKWCKTKISVRIRCYPEHNKEHCQAFWEGILRREVKVVDKTWLGKKRKMYSQNGLCVLSFTNIEFYHRIIRWLDLWRAELRAVG